MSFFDLPEIPRHHGQPVAYTPERTIQPTRDEAREMIEAMGVTVAWCHKCRERFYYTRYLYPGGWGPLHRQRRNIAQLAARLKEPRESDWVWGYCPETYQKVKRTVR